MSNLHSVGESAAILSTATGQSADSIARQIRSWLQQGVVTPTSREQRGTTGKIAAAMFSGRDLAALRLIMVLAGSPLQTLTHAWRDMRQAVDARLELPPIEGTFPPRGIDAVVQSLAVNDGHAWVFHTVSKLNVKTGERFLMGGFIRDDQMSYPESDPRSLSTMWEESDLLVEGGFTIRATEILRPLLDSVRD